MTVNYSHSLNNMYSPYNLRFKGDVSVAQPLAKPIEKVQKSIENVTDTFIKTPEDEHKKKSKKATIAVASSVLVMTGIITLLNPKYSSKWIEKLKNWQLQSKTKADTNGEVKSKLYKAWSKLLGGTVDALGFVNNFNSIKDIWFKKLCEKSFMKKPHETITKWFDTISKHTVMSKYKSAHKKMDVFESLVEQYKSKLPEDAKKQLEIKLREAKDRRNFFLEDNIKTRFKTQESLMSDLETQTSSKIKQYFSGIGDIFLGRKHNSGQFLKDNMSFWAEDIIKPKRDIVDKEGIQAVEKLIGNTSGVKGSYNEILEIINPHLTAEEKTLLEKSFKKASKKLKKANTSECIEYFDKKRDLMLGSAPTDIVTGLGLIGLGGAAVGTAHSRDERISKTITVAAPAVLGMGTAIVTTAMLFSGVQGMIIGTLTGAVLNRIGSYIDRKVLGHNPKLQEEAVNA